MTILESILEEINTSDLTEQVRELCEKIYVEQQPNFKYPEVEPVGPNIFLSVEVPGKTDREVGYLSLEREGEEEYIAVFETIETKKIVKGNREESPSLRRQKVWEINENKATKILTKFAKIYRTLRGE